MFSRLGGDLIPALAHAVVEIGLAISAVGAIADCVRLPFPEFDEPWLLSSRAFTALPELRVEGPLADVRNRLPLALRHIHLGILRRSVLMELRPGSRLYSPLRT